MKQNKNIISISFILLLIVIFFMIFQKYQELNTVETDAIQAVPINAALIIESDNWSASINELENSTIWSTITEKTSWAEVDSSVNTIKTYLENSLELKHFFENTAVISFCHTLHLQEISL